MALCPLDNPESNVTMKDNFKLMKSQVQIQGCTKIAASFAGLCFGAVKENTQLMVWNAIFCEAGDQE